MKVKQQQHHHHLSRGSWDLPNSHRHLCSLAPKLDSFSAAPSSSTPLPTKPSPKPQESAAAGGTRWNPTQEQIGILEMLYSRGMRTPNSQQIEHIALQLSKFGKIQGKNVFYWFQNHKARERQKLKRLSTTTIAAATSFFTFHDQTSKEKAAGTTEELITSKKKCTSWSFERLLEESNDALINNTLANFEINTDHEEGEKHLGVKKTLQLFPLHPEYFKLGK
ncbi:hypothetical protein V2J09_023833 [Rumex salicifolius]